MGKELVRKTGEKQTAQAKAIKDIAKVDNIKLNKKTGEEVKDRRLNLVIEPSVWEDFTTLASMKRTKPNTLFCELIRQYVEDNAGDLQQYKQLLEKLG